MHATPPFSRRALIAAGATAMGAGTWARPAVAQADTTPEPAAAPDWSAVDALLAAAAPRVTLLASELIDGVPSTIHAYNADAVFPIGSTFKFWILGALALKIQAGELAWEDEIVIEDRFKSVPGGDLRYAPEGSVFTIRYVAERMMQKSDNTATDHLFYLVGRENVEAAMIAMGHSNPSLNIPMLSTRELVVLKFASPTEYVDAYLARSPEERRELLEAEIQPTGLDIFYTLPDPDGPVEIDRIEWFATRHDLAATVAWIQAKTDEPGLRPLTEVIALETQLAFDGETWPYAGFKGGSEPGVLSGTWLLHRADGRRFIYSVGFADTEKPIDMPAAIAALEAGRDALALVP